MYFVIECYSMRIGLSTGLTSDEPIVFILKFIKLVHYPINERATLDNWLAWAVIEALA